MFPPYPVLHPWALKLKFISNIFNNILGYLTQYNESRFKLKVELCSQKVYFINVRPGHVLYSKFKQLIAIFIINKL